MSTIEPQVPRSVGSARGKPIGHSSTVSAVTDEIVLGPSASLGRYLSQH